MRFSQVRMHAAPGTAGIEAIIEAAFWASLRRGGGYVPRISLAFRRPGDSEIVFEVPTAAAACGASTHAPCARGGARAYRILVFDRGRMVEEGTHEMLVRKLGGS